MDSLRTALMVTVYLIGFVAVMCITGLVFGKVEELFKPKKKGEKKMTNIKEFERELLKAIEKSGHTAQIKEYYKQGDQKMRNLVVDAQDGISPAVPIKDLHDMYLHGLTLDALVENVLSLEKPAILEDADTKIKKNLCYRLVNKENNKELLKTTPHKTICNDMALCLQAIMSDGDDGYYVALINKDMFEYKMWGIAETTAPTLSPARLTAMMDVDLRYTQPFDGADNLLITGLTTEDEMYVLDTENGLHGASALFYDGVKERIYDLVGEYYALPSSIHEWIIVPVHDGTEEEVKALKAMVKEANTSVVDTVDMLSNHPYVYDGTELKIA